MLSNNNFDFMDYDTVQVTTSYKDCRITRRRGLLIGMELDDKGFCTSAGTVNSNFSKYSAGVEIQEGVDSLHLLLPTTRAYLISIMLCRIVLIEKKNIDLITFSYMIASQKCRSDGGI
jgi:hypothetical protein